MSGLGAGKSGKIGSPDSMRAEARGRAVVKGVVMTPWEERWYDYAEYGGIKVPMRGEVGLAVGYAFASLPRVGGATPGHALAKTRKGNASWV